MCIRLYVCSQCKKGLKSTRPPPKKKKKIYLVFGDGDGAIKYLNDYDHEEFIESSGTTKFYIYSFIYSFCSIL